MVLKIRITFYSILFYSIKTDWRTLGSRTVQVLTNLQVMIAYLGPHQNSLNHMVLGDLMVEPSKCPFRWFWWPDLMVLAPKPSKCAIRWFWFCHEIVQVINV